MASLLNGLFAGRAGLASHGIALGVIGDNISNVNTIGHKASRAEFSDLIAGRSSNVTVGVGSEVVRTTQIFEQGTLELTGRDLDVAIDGNGFFVVQDNTGGRFYTRAGNFKVSSDGIMVTQGGFKVLGYPANGSGALQELDLSAVSQDNVDTGNVSIAGNVDAREPVAGTIPTVNATSTTTYADLSAVAAYSTSLDVFDTQGGSHTVTMFFFKQGTNDYIARAYVNSDDVDVPVTTPGLPRLLEDSTGATDFEFDFNVDGTIDTTTSVTSLDLETPWNNGSVVLTGTLPSINFSLSNFTQFSASSAIQAITQDGQGVGNITSVSVDEDGTVSTILDNGQEAIIGKIALANFANPEALSRVGGQLLQKSTQSGEPVVGTPDTGTFGVLAAESVELSTVDIADQFVKLITLQRGFQANSRIITTVNQLLAELIQLA